MNILEVPYLKRFIEPNGETTKFVSLVNKICGIDDHKRDLMGSLMRKICHAHIAQGQTGAKSVEYLNHQLYQLRKISSELKNDSQYALPHVSMDMVLFRPFRHHDTSTINTMLNNLCEYKDEEVCRDLIVDELELTYCDGCDEYEYRDEMSNTHGGDIRCRNCIENYYRFSEYYDEYLYSEDSIWAMTNDGEVLASRYDDNFEFDEDNDRWVHVDYQPPAPPIIGNYHSSKCRHRLIKDDWSVEHHRWFGVELEVEVNDGFDRYSKAKQLNEQINSGEVGSKVFFETDGSLNNGFEIITHAMSLPAHQTLWNWLKDRSSVSGLRSHNTRTCGLHVHVNRDGLSGIQIARMVTFINDPTNEQLIRAIARRYGEGYCKIKKKTLDTALDSPDRYEALNVTSHQTVEFRLFRGSLRYESVMAALEFSNSLVDFCSIYTKAEDLNTPNFMSFINDDKQGSNLNLRPYIAERLQLN